MSRKFFKEQRGWEKEGKEIKPGEKRRVKTSQGKGRSKIQKKGFK